MASKPIDADKSSAADKYKKLIDQANKYKESAKDEYLAKATEAIKDLKGLGYEYELKEKKGRSTKETKKGTIADKPCPICNFKTRDSEGKAHDSRAHRGQEKKKPFTDKELEERGWKKVT